jgi:pimeloyl-ACP methyl ester carboxylesterase
MLTPARRYLHTSAYGRDPWGTSMEQPTQASVTSTDGTEIAYWRSGHGPPLVLVHGTTQDHTRWDAVRPALAEHFTVFAMDRRGRGGSGDAPTYSVELEFADVAAVVDQVCQETGRPVQLVAHSYGALCSLEAALLTTHVDKLVLYEPPVHPESTRLPPGFVDDLVRLSAEGQREKVLARFSMVVLGRSAEEVAQMRTDSLWPSRVAAAHTVARETALEQSYQFDPSRFIELRIPTLLLQGTESPSFLKDSTVAVQAALPHARLVLLHGQAHQGITTAPDLFVREVLSFLR